MAAKKKKASITKANIDEIIRGIEVDNGTTVVTLTEEPTLGPYPSLAPESIVMPEIAQILKAWEHLNELVEKKVIDPQTFLEEKGKIREVLGFMPVEQEVEIQYVERVTEIVREVLVEKPMLEGFALFKKLKDERYPQGGMGEWWEDPNGTDKVYVPRPEEIYTHFLGNKQEWDELRDALVRVWIEHSLR